MSYWLMKSEPSTFSIEDLINCPNHTDGWDGVRNYQARNMLRDQFKIGDLAFFYHSNCKEPGIVAIVKIVSDSYPDPTAFDTNSKYFDPKSNPEHPRWFLVDVQFAQMLPRKITLNELKTHQELTELALVKKGNRLSVMPVTRQQWEYILSIV